MWPRPGPTGWVASFLPTNGLRNRLGREQKAIGVRRTGDGKPANAPNHFPNGSAERRSGFVRLKSVVAAHRSEPAMGGSAVAASESTVARIGSVSAADGSGPAVRGSAVAAGASEPAVRGSALAVRGSAVAADGSEPAVRASEVAERGSVNAAGGREAAAAIDPVAGGAGRLALNPSSWVARPFECGVLEMTLTNTRADAPAMPKLQRKKCCRPVSFVSRRGSST